MRDDLKPWVASSEDDGMVGDQPVFAAPSKVAVRHEHAVQWAGPWEEATDGTAQATRRYAASLAAAGVPVLLRAGRGWITDETGARVMATEATLDPTVKSEVALLRQTTAREVSAIVSHFIPTPESARAILYPGRSQFIDTATVEKTHAMRIALIVLERDRVSPQLARYLSRFAAVIVPCYRNALALVNSDVPREKIHVVEHPYPENSIIRTIGFERMRPGPGPFVFYSIAKWEPRKSTHEAIGAFLRSFRPEEQAMFAIKTSEFGRWDGYPDGPVSSVREWLRDPEVAKAGWTIANVSTRLRITTERLSEDEIAQMHAIGHCYVSASHGEAWDMPAFDATVARARLVHVGFGGSEHYAAPNAISVADSDPCVPCHRGYGWGDALWANVSVDRIGEAMRKAFLERQAGDAIDLAPYSFEAIGKKLRKVVSGVVRGYGGAPAWLDGEA